MGRIIAIDYGTRRTGIAVSDPLQLIAGGLATVETRELERYLTQYIAREDVSVIVVGKPLKMNGAPSETMRFVLPLVARLHRTYPSIEVVLYDERFTSAIAHRAMLDGGLRKMARRNRALVDKISATIILEDFMSSRRAEQHRYTQVDFCRMRGHFCNFFDIHLSNSWVVSRLRGTILLPNNL